jgi:glyoxylase-like metal-dependent hydrolase (beta-lactamase superfamily II)
MEVKAVEKSEKDLTNKERKPKMIEEVFPNIFRMEIPLPKNPLKAINSYLIMSGDRFLMVDTGMNRVECMEAMQSSLKELQVNLTQIDFFITHLHADHLGLVSELAQDSSEIYFNYPDQEVMNDINHWDEMAASARMNGFPEFHIQAAIANHPGRKYHARRSLNVTPLKEGDQLAVGEYFFQCVETPGHTRGHMCLYEPRTKIFFSGDHILNDITPNIALWSEDDDPLQQYLKSLDKIDGYKIERVLPGHRSLFHDHRRRIAELKEHHEVRNGEVLNILQTGRQNAYQVASQMTWDIDCDRWEDFPLPQQWFAGGEALAHLQYLQGEGPVKKEIRQEKVFFSLA